MPKKIAGKLNQPPAQADFDKIAIGKLCSKISGIYYRLHSENPTTKQAWSPLHFSRRGNTRFDPKGGVGTLCVGDTLPGAMMELFDDHWDAVGTIGRSVTEQQLASIYVSLVGLPKVNLFDATGANLSKIGTDAQLLTGLYSTTRKWASRLMSHPSQIDGILFRSRHDLSRLNIALFQRAQFLPHIVDGNLSHANFWTWNRQAAQGDVLIHGPAVLLRDHPLLNQALIELQVARMP